MRHYWCIVDRIQRTKASWCDELVTIIQRQGHCHCRAIRLWAIRGRRRAEFDIRAFTVDSWIIRKAMNEMYSRLDEVDVVAVTSIHPLLCETRIRAGWKPEAINQLLTVETVTSLGAKWSMTRSGDQCWPNVGESGCATDMRSSSSSCIFCCVRPMRSGRILWASSRRVLVHATGSTVRFS